MKMQLIFLGTGAMVPTKERNHTSLFLRYKAEGIMFDCGEGTQRQLKIAGIRPSQVTKIVLSHWDGDHVLGLPGLIQTLAMSEDDKSLGIWGPPGTKQRFLHMLKAFEFHNKISLEISEYAPGCFLECSQYTITAHLLEHKVPCFGFEWIEKDRLRINIEKVRKLGMKDGPMLGRLQQGLDVKFQGKTVKAKEATYTVCGKKIGIISDTRLCRACYDIAQDKDLVVCDSTFAKKDGEKAHEYYHMTSEQAARVASESGAKKLVLTHISQRYREADLLLEEARIVFPEAVLAYDFMKIKI